MEVGNLKPTSCKLLLHLLVNGGSAENLSALATTLGMTRDTLREARQQLLTLGLLDEKFVTTLAKISSPPGEKIATVTKISPPTDESFVTHDENLATLYKSLFGAPLPQATEQEWMALQPLSEILPVMQYAASKGIEKPIPYVTKALKNKAAKAPVFTPLAQKTDHTGELMEVTPEMRAGWARAEELLRRRGKGYLLDDDDD